RILQQFMIEGLVLSGAAAVLGTGMALGAVRLVRSVKPANLNLDLSSHVNVAIVAVLCGLALLTALISSVWPAWLAGRDPIEPALKQGGPQLGSGRRQNRIRSLLVAGEVALSLTLLVCCGLLLRTIYSLRQVPLGFRVDHIVVAHLTIPTYQYSRQNVVVDLYQPLLERVQHLQGVQVAGYISEVPLGHTFGPVLSYSLYGKSVVASLKAVTPDIQHVFGFRMLAGRFFNEQDTANSLPVVVVNRAFAQLYARNQHDPSSLIGQHFLNLRKNVPAVIVGVLDDARQTSIAKPSQPEVEICLPQLTPGGSVYRVSTVAMDLAVRTEGAPSAIIPVLRSIFRAENPELAHATFDTMGQVVEDSYGSQRLAAHLLEIFGASALLLAIAGLYGLLAWVVAQRTREMGIRIALGAGRRNLLWLVMRQAGGMLLVGIAFGVGLAWMSARFVRTYLYGVSAYDGWTMAAAAALLCASGLLAAYIPARRAARVDPITALRAE
ncbi:MAG: FtsX-like permease family protein, partial [Terracidiphilus sp.]